jgi:hypothetical protein
MLSLIHATCTPALNRASLPFIPFKMSNEVVCTVYNHDTSKCLYSLITKYVFTHQRNTVLEIVPDNKALLQSTGTSLPRVCGSSSEAAMVQTNMRASDRGNTAL